jgi:glycosidase
VNPDRPWNHQSGPKDDPAYDVAAPRPDEARRHRLMAAFQFADPGLPVVYYGDEAGMWGAGDPDCRKPMLWPDLRYEEEQSHPLGQSRRRDAVRADPELLKFYQALTRARATRAALRRGTIETVLADDARRLYAFARQAEDGDRVVAAFNGSDKELTVELPFATPSRDLLTGRRFRAKDGKTAVPLPALSAALLGPDTGH